MEREEETHQRRGSEGEGGGAPKYFRSAWCKARYAENPDAYR